MYVQLVLSAFFVVLTIFLLIFRSSFRGRHERKTSEENDEKREEEKSKEDEELAISGHTIQAVDSSSESLRHFLLPSASRHRTLT